MATPKICKCCGQIIPPDASKWFAGKPVQKRIYDYVARHTQNVSSFEIADAIYADDPDGGSDFRCVSVHIWRMNKELAKHKLRIQGRKGRGGTYSLIQI